ncbi:MAG: hypothetical protein K6F73_03220 [Lachnospiraceae bacterium]|nr:hypothetical protein [Lachnospiraceae bacterium]
MYPIEGYYDDRCGAVTPNLTSAAPGQMVYLTVGPQNNYQLYEIRINGVPLEWEDHLYKIVSTAQQIFVFEMPDNPENGKVKIDATFHSLTDMFGGGITWDFSPNYWAEADSTAVKFDESGDKTRINVYSAKTGLPIGPWALQFTTSNENIASVDEYGMITALKEGSATVSISNPIGTKRSITVYVKHSKLIAEMLFDDYFDRVNNEALPFEDRIMIEDASVLAPNSPYNDTGMYIIEFDVDAIARKDHTFNPELMAYAWAEDEEHELVDPPEVDYETPLLACTEWSPVDKSIATVQKAKTGLNTNLVTVKKGTYGDCLIEVKITNADKSVVRGGFIVRVRDTAPRMKNSSITLNVQQGEGTVVNCVPMYGYDVDEGTELVVCTKSYANGLPVYNPMGGFSAHVEQIPVLDEDGNQVIDEQTGLPVFDKVIKLSVEKDEVRFRPGTKVTFTGDIIRLYICGKQKRGTGTPVDFHMPINTVTVINELPKVQLSYVGKINLLYDETYENNETNCVKAMLNVSNIPDLKIEYVELMTTANYNLVEYFGPMPADDELNHNFQWDGTTLKNYLGSDIGFVIRVPDGIADDDQFEKNPTTNAIINSGVARIKFAGYENTTNVFVTVPCGYDFPRYTLSTARVSTSKYFENPYYRVQIINNGVNPKRSVQLYENEGDDPAVPGDALWEAENDYSLTGTKPGDFWNEPTVPSDFGEENREPERDANGDEVKDPITNKTIYNDFILLSANGIPTNGKERILFKMNWWRKPMTFDFTMTMLASKATATTNPATATLTRYVPSQVARMNLKCNLADAEFDGIDFLEFKGNARTMGNAAAALMGNINFELADPAKKLPAAITASLDGLNLDDPEADDYIKNGSYAFTAKALLSFGGTALDIDDCPTVRFSIAVNGTVPRLTFKKPTFSLNTIYSGFGEVAECPITVTGLGAGVEYEIDDTLLDQIYLEHAAQNYPVGWKGDVVEYDRADKEYHLVNANGTWRQRFEFGVKEDDNGRKTILTVKFKNKLSAGSFNYSYYIYNIPIKTYVDDVEGTDLSFVSCMNRYRITIQGHERRDSVSFTAKGSFNQVIQEKIYPVSPTVEAEIAGAEMVYTAKISNLNGKIDKVKFAEVNIVTNKYYKNAGGENWSPHFEFVELDPDKNTVTLKLRRDYIMGKKDEGVEPLASGRNHVLWIHYHIKERDGKEWNEDGAKWGSTQLSIQPRQVLPNLQNIITEDYLYAGGTIDKRTYAIKLGKLNNQTAMFCDAPANPFLDQTGNTDVIKIADNAPENIRRAFKVVQVAQDDWTDPDHRLWLTDNNGNAIVDNKGNKIPCGIVVIQLIQPSLLVEGKIYNVPIEVRYVDQMKTVKGTIVRYPIMVVK